MTAKSILVTGATGFVGGAVVERLQEAPYEVHCLVRSDEGAASLRKRFPGVRAHRGDLGDPDSLRRALEGRDWLLNCAGLNSFWERVPYSHRDGSPGVVASPYYRLNVAGTHNLMTEAGKAGLTKVVHVSTVMAYGFPAEMPFHESSTPGPHVSDYARSKFDGDAQTWELWARGGLPLTVVYLAAVLGRGDPKAVMQIERFVRGGIPLMIRSDNLFTYVYIRDAAEAIVQAAEMPGNEGEAYLVGAERLSTGQYFSLLSELSGVPVPKRSLGRGAALFLAGLLNAWARLTGRAPLLPLDLMRTQFQGSLIFDGSKAERELGIRYTPLRKALQEAVEEARERIRGD